MLTNIFNLKTLQIVTFIIALLSTYVAIELILAEEIDGSKHIVINGRCDDEAYYKTNENECDGFIYSFFYCAPPVVAVTIIWLFVWSIPIIRKYL